MSTSRRLACLVFSSAIGLLACGGLDTEEAQAECDSIRKSQAQCMTDAAYDSCVACYEDCGVDCAQLESCPLQFSCD